MNQFSRRNVDLAPEVWPASFSALASRMPAGPSVTLVGQLADAEAARAIGLCDLRRAIK